MGWCQVVSAYLIFPAVLHVATIDGRGKGRSVRHGLALQHQQLLLPVRSPNIRLSIIGQIIVVAIVVTVNLMGC